jgi:hypothetical protein
MGLVFYNSKSYGDFSIQSNKACPPSHPKPYFLIFHDPDECGDPWEIDGTEYPGGDSEFEEFAAAEQFLYKTFPDIKRVED